MRTALLVFLFSWFTTAYAHQPDLSSLMIYEQNGKTLLAIKCALTALEGEVDFCFNKNSYKTPDEFCQRVAELFKKKCFVLVNNDSIKLINPIVLLGHETTLFAELDNPPQNKNSVYVKNTLFKDMPNNMCAFILVVNGLPLKQCILNNENNHAVNLKLEKGKWVVEESNASFLKNIIGGGLFFLIVSIAAFFLYKKNKNIS